MNKICIGILLIFMLFIFTSATPGYRVKFKWNPPETLALNKNCEDISFKLSPEARKHIHYIIKWRKKGATKWNKIYEDQPQFELKQLQKVGK